MDRTLLVGSRGFCRDGKKRNGFGAFNFALCAKPTDPRHAQKVAKAVRDYARKSPVTQLGAGPLATRVKQIYPRGERPR